MDYYVMSGDIIVGKWKNGAFSCVDKARAPMYLANTGNFELWLETRAIDCHRANSRVLKKALRLAERDDISTVISVHAATVADNYWIKPFDSELSYCDIQFNYDYFAELALRGDYDSFNKVAGSGVAHTPELTNTGSFEKCWRLIDGEWTMEKSADRLQQFSEIFIYEFGRRLGFNMAEYSPGRKSVITKNFTCKGAYNFEPAYSFMGDDEDYIAVVKKLREIAPHTVSDYVRLIFMDTIVANPDRHTFNFGLLRDSGAGDVVSLAPNFDNNMALVARGYPKNVKRENDALVKYFNELTAFDPSLLEYIPRVRAGDAAAAIKTVNIAIKTDTVVNFIMNGYKQINGAVYLD